jgi:hypothetical protein
MQWKIELAQSKKIGWSESVPAPALGQEVDQVFLDCISGLPRFDGEILEAAKSLSKGNGHRYAR